LIASKPYRIGIVGASSLAGKELSDTLAESTLAASDIILLDDEELAGQITAAGDEVTFIQKIDGDSFAAMDFVFFAGGPEATKKYWKTARLAGASIIDMTYALEAEAGVVVRGPLALPASTNSAAAQTNPLTHEPDLTTPAVVAAHPVTLMLLLVAGRVQTTWRSCHRRWVMMFRTRALTCRSKLLACLSRRSCRRQRMKRI
jgi:aspartate-semialdehyde dehydrogenase